MGAVTSWKEGPRGEATEAVATRRFPTIWWWGRWWGEGYRVSCAADEYSGLCHKCLQGLELSIWEQSESPSIYNSQLRSVLGLAGMKVAYMMNIAFNSICLFIQK